MRQTKQIGDPRWDDITDRDALIRQLAHVVRGQLFERDGRPDLVAIDDAIEDALTAIDGPITGSIGGEPSDAELDAAVSPLPTRAELLLDGHVEDLQASCHDAQGVTFTPLGETRPDPRTRDQYVDADGKARSGYLRAAVIDKLEETDDLSAAAAVMILRGRTGASKE